MKGGLHGLDPHLLRDLGLRPDARSLSIFNFHED